MEEVKREKQIQSLEAKLAYQFKDQKLLEQALTHSSFANECNLEHNERLEFLGDAVLELCVSQALYLKFAHWREGDLTKKRSQLVSTASLANLARKTGVQDLLKLGHGEDLQGGRKRDSVLSDAMEAVLAAVYLDGGFLKVKQTVEQLFAKMLEDEVVIETKDYKTSLQEIVQRDFKTIPIYTQLKCTGPDHAKIFTVELKLPNGQVFVGTGSSFKRAEQDTARLALESLTLDS